MTRAALLVALALHGRERPASAAAPPIEWSGDPGCPAAPFDDALARYLGPAPQRPPPPLTIDARAERAGDGWRVTLRIEDARAPDEPASERVLTAPSCETVARAAAFVVAVAIDPGVARATAEGAPEDPVEDPDATDALAAPELPEAPPTSPAAAQGGSRPDTRQEPNEGADENADENADEKPSEVPERPRRPPTRRLHALLNAALGLDGGALPGVGAAARASVGLGGRRWRAELFASYRSPSRARASTLESAGGWISLWALGARACAEGQPERGRLVIPICAGLEAGELIGRGYGLTTNGRARLPWLAPLVGAGVLARLDRPRATWGSLALGARAELGAPLARHRFEITDVGVVHTVRPAFARLLLVLEIELPRGRADAARRRERDDAAGRRAPR